MSALGPCPSLSQMESFIKHPLLCQNNSGCRDTDTNHKKSQLMNIEYMLCIILSSLKGIDLFQPRDKPIRKVLLFAFYNERDEGT